MPLLELLYLVQFRNQMLIVHHHGTIESTCFGRNNSSGRFEDFENKAEISLQYNITIY